MLIHDLFERKIERRIEPVVFVGNLEEQMIQTEIEEFVITQEIGNRIELLISAYTARGRIPSIGVWLSGYFGSGKSHLLKMLSFLLENRSFGARTTNDIFLEKLADDPTLRNDLLSLKSIPSESILFNIDQQAEQDTATRVDSILAVFFKMFNNHCGYFGNMGHVAQFERDLDNEGLYNAFKIAYREIAGRPWEEGRKTVILQRPNIDKAYARARQIAEGEVNNIIAQYQANYSISVDTFADLVNQYIERQPNKQFRLNFFVDEVGQFIAARVELMLNLQSISETLGERCGGRCWVMVTSQSELPTLAASLSNQQQGIRQDFTRIQARFVTKLHLTSKSVDEVLHKRLLAKTPDAATALSALHAEQGNNYRTLFSFGPESATFNRPFDSEKSLILSYPFVPYQFDLFQQAIVRLSEQGAFTGASLSVGARSLLASSQHALLTYGDKQIGSLVPFDAFYEGTAASLRELFVNGILLAERRLTDPLAIRVLKALFLIKYVPGIEGTLANIRVLLYNAFNTPMQQFDRQVAQALLILEQQAYIQRDGDVYAYLTDEEKDIEEQIRQIVIDQYDIAKEVEKFVFSRVLGTNKFRMVEYNQDYSFTRLVDGHPPIGMTHELSVHIITPVHSYTDIGTIRSHTADRPTLTIVLPDTLPFIEEIRSYKQTEQFVRSFNAAAAKDSTRTLVEMRGTQNHRRESAILQMARDLLNSATYICNMTDIPVGSGDAVSKFNAAMFALIRQIYPSRAMYTNTFDASDVTKYIMRPVLEVDSVLAPAEQDIYNTINLLHRQSQSITLKKILDVYTVRPFGWQLYPILAFLGNLYRLGKIEMRYNASMIDKQQYASITGNNNASQNISIIPEAVVPPAKIQLMRQFFSSIFGETLTAQSASQISDVLKQRLTIIITELNGIYARRDQYPFVHDLAPVIARYEELRDRPTTWYFTEFSNDLRDAFLELHEGTVLPIRQFMAGAQRTRYDELATLARDDNNNAAEADGTLLATLRSALQDPTIYTRLQTLTDTKARLERAIADLVASTRSQAISQISTRYDTLILADPRWPQHTAQSQNAINAKRDTCAAQITSTTSIVRIRQLAADFIDTQVTHILNVDLVLPVPPPPQPPVVGPGGGTVPLIIQPPPPVPQISFVNYKNVSFDAGLSKITNEADLERFLNAQREALSKILGENKQILL
jgi:hypothetical protein